MRESGPVGIRKLKEVLPAPQILKINDMKKHSSVVLNGTMYSVIELDNPKVGYSGQCDYYYHCHGECVLKFIVGSNLEITH